MLDAVRMRPPHVCSSNLSNLKLVLIDLRAVRRQSQGLECDGLPEGETELWRSHNKKVSN